MVVCIVVSMSCICLLGVAGYFIHYMLWGKREKWPNALVRHTHTHIQYMHTYIYITFLFRTFTHPCVNSV